MIKQDAAKYTDFCHHIEGCGGFSPWLDEYDPLTETGFAFVHCSSEDNGQFGLGDIDLNFGTTEFSYKDILEKVKQYRDDCEGSMDLNLPEECDYVDELDDLVEAIQAWCDKNESTKSEGVEALKDKVVSDGTLKPEDLIPKFLNALKHDETAHSKFLKDFPEVLEIQSWDDVDDETKSMLVDELTDVLNGIAPDGYFFGASDGDGACFGFWKVDPDESKKSEDYKNFTLKQLRFQLKNGWAKDLTNASDEEIQAIIDSGHEISGVSNGTYGMNGLKVTYSNPDGSIGSGVVIGRTPNLFALLSPQKPKKTGDAPKPSESKKSEALTKDTVIVGTLDNTNKKWIERTLQQIKKKFPNVESDAFGCTITVRGKLADVAKVLNAYPKGIPSWCADKGGDFLPNAAGDNLDDNEVSKVLSESKKNEGVGGKIKMGIDYNMFMRMCASAAYLDDNEDYWDALWEYYSEMGEIEDACEFFDNLFQYTSWCDEDEVYDEYLDDSYKDGTKSKAECIDAAVDAGDLDVFKTDKGYLVIQ